MISTNWIDEYIKRMFPVNNANLKIEEAQRIKYINFPNSLFKYRAVNDYSLQNLEEDTIWMANPSNFNDPYDCGISFQSEPLEESLLRYKVNDILESVGVTLSKDEIQKITNSKEFIEEFFRTTFSRLDDTLTNEQLDQLAIGMRSFIQEQHKGTVDNFRRIFLNYTFVSCFSERNDSILMWSHYADYHKGFCVEYDYKSLGVTDPRLRLLNPVVYKDEMFDLSEYINIESITNESTNNIIATYAAMIKSTDWSYEKEWRLIMPSGIFESERLYQAPKPVAIYLGVKISEENKNKLIDIANRRDIKLYQMKMQSNKFQLYQQEL